MDINQEHIVELRTELVEAESRIADLEAQLAAETEKLAERDRDAERYRFVRKLGIRLSWNNHEWVATRLLGFSQQHESLDVLLDRMSAAKEPNNG